MRGLQIAVNQKIKKCKKCDNENLVTNFTTGPYFFIDLERL